MEIDRSEPVLPAIGNRAHLAALAWVGLPLAVVLVIHWQTVRELASLWASTQDYGHGYLIAPISLFLIWRQRARLAAAPLAPWPWALALSLGASALWLAAYLIGVQVGMQIALLMVIGATLWTTLGWERARWVLFPVGYLVFAIPVWTVVVPPLQELTADVATYGVRWLGIPVFREGPFLTIPGGRFEIAEVCAGLRFLMASMSLAALYGYLNFEDGLRRGIFFALGVVWAIFFNWVRVVIVIWLGHTLGMDAQIVQDHNSVGWVLFAVSLVPLFAIGHFMQSAEPGDSHTSPAPRDSGVSTKPMGIGVWGTVCIALLVASSGPVAAGYVKFLSQSVSPLAPVEMPASIGKWRRVESTTEWNPAYAGADSVLRSAYAVGPRRVSAFVARFAFQSQGKELINDINFPYDPERWSVVSSESVIWTIEGEAVPATRLRLRGPAGTTREVQYLYIVAQRPTVRPIDAKLLQLRGLLRGSTQAAVIALASDQGEGIGDANAIGAALAVPLLGRSAVE